jgi:hypothetical protein
MEYGQKLMPTGRQGDFFPLARGQEPFAKGFAPRVVARGHKGAHVQYRAHVRQVLAASSEGVQLLRLGGRQRPGCRSDHVGTRRQCVGIQRLGLGQLSGGEHARSSSFPATRVTEIAKMIDPTTAVS